MQRAGRAAGERCHSGEKSNVTKGVRPWAVIMRWLRPNGYIQRFSDKDLMILMLRIISAFFELNKVDMTKRSA